MKRASGMALEISVNSETQLSETASRACSTQDFHKFSSQDPLEIVGELHVPAGTAHCQAGEADSDAVLPSLPRVSYGVARVFGRQSMRYNWDRAPTGFERHRKALAAAILIAGGVGLMLAALPL